MKRQLFGIFLLLCLVFPLTITYIYHRCQRRAIRREVKHALMAKTNKSDLVLLSFTEEEANNQLNWKHSKEFEYKGSMYDIVERETKGDTTYYWCWWDNKETQLNKKLDEMLALIMGHNKEDKKSNKRLIQFYKSLFWQENTIAINNKSYWINHLSNYLLQISEVYFAPLSPPPRV